MDLRNPVQISTDVIIGRYANGSIGCWDLSARCFCDSKIAKAAIQGAISVDYLALEKAGYVRKTGDGDLDYVVIH